MIISFLSETLIKCPICGYLILRFAIELSWPYTHCSKCDTDLVITNRKIEVDFGE